MVSSKLFSLFWNFFRNFSLDNDVIRDRIRQDKSNTNARQGVGTMRTKTFNACIRLSQNEREHIEQEAQKDGITFSEWVRRKIIGNTLESRVERIEAILTDLQRRIA